MRRVIVGLFVVLVALAGVAQPVAAANTRTGTGAIDETADAAHNPYIDGDVTKDTHEMGWGPMEYEDDSGDLATLPAELNTTVDNPYSLTYSEIETSAYSAFPRSTIENAGGDRAVDADEWSTATSDATNVTPSASNVTTAVGVEAVEVATGGGMGSGDTATFTYSNFSITSDAQKRYAQFVFDVNTLDAATHVDIKLVDADGDYVNASVDSSENADTGNTAANATGSGYVFQEQAGAMTVYGTGDGTMGEIQKVEVVFADGDANIDFAGINAEKTSPWTLGKQQVDTDSDDALETQTVLDVNTSGDVSLVSLDSMGTIYDAATIHDLTVPFKAYSSMMPVETDYERWNVTYSAAEDYPSFEKKVNDHRRLMVPDAYELAYKNLELRDTVAVPANRYGAVEYATGVGTTNFSKITWTAATSSYDTKGDTVTLATGLSGGQEVALHYDDYRVTIEEFKNISSTGGGGAPMDDSGGGLGNIPLIGGAIIAILSFLGLRGG